MKNIITETVCAIQSNHFNDMRRIFHESDNKYTFVFFTSMRSLQLWDSVTKHVFFLWRITFLFLFYSQSPFYLSNKGIIRESVEKRCFKNIGSLCVSCLNNLIRLRHISGTCSHYHASNTAHDDDIIKFIMGNVYMV